MATYNFTGANGDSLPSGLVALDGTFEIQNNKLEAATMGASLVAIVYEDSGFSDGSIEQTINCEGLTANRSGAVFRVNDVNNYLTVRVTASSGLVDLIRLQSSSSASLGTYTIPSFSASTDYQLKVVFSGSSISVEIDGTERITATSTFNQTREKHGALFGNTSFSIDNLNVLVEAAESETITVNAVPLFRPYDTTTNNFNVVFTGSVGVATASTAVQWSLIHSDDNTTVSGYDWAELIAAVDIAEPDDSWTSATITLPASLRRYKAKFRFSDNTPIETTSNEFFAGYHITLTGQSLGNFLYTEGSGTPTSGVYYGNGSTGAITTPSAGAGAIALGNSVIAYTSLPVLITNSCQGGLAVIENNASSAGYYLYDPATPTSHYNLLLEQITEFNGVNSVINVHGEQDAKLLSGTFADVKAGFEGLFAKIRTDASDADLPFVVSILGGWDASQNAPSIENVNAVRDLQREIADADANMVYINRYDLPLTDGIHLTTAGNITHGQRLAAAIKNQVLGDTSAWESGKISGAVQSNDTTVALTITHAQGTDFTPTTGITDLSLSTDGTTFSEVPNTVVRTNATTFTATVASGVYTHFRYNYKALPDLTGNIVDNSSLNLPLDTTQSTITSSTSSTLTTSITGMVDGTYQTFLFSGTTEVFNSTLTYTSGAATTPALSIAAGTSLTGYVIDNNATPIDGAVIVGTTV